MRAVTDITRAEEQRRSFAFGNTNIENSDITREVVNKVADRIESTHVTRAEVEAARAYRLAVEEIVRLTGEQDVVAAVRKLLQTEAENARLTNALANISMNAPGRGGSWADGVACAALNPEPLDATYGQVLGGRS